MSTDDIRNRAIQDAVEVLSRHFDAVQIVASSLDGEQLSFLHLGKGSIYTRIAMSEHFLRDQDEFLKNEWKKRHGR